MMSRQLTECTRTYTPYHIQIWDVVTLLCLYHKVLIEWYFSATSVIHSYQYSENISGRFITDSECYCVFRIFTTFPTDATVGSTLLSLLEAALVTL